MRSCREGKTSLKQLQHMCALCSLTTVHAVSFRDIGSCSSTVTRRWCHTVVARHPHIGQGYGRRRYGAWPVAAKSGTARRLGVGRRRQQQAIYCAIVAMQSAWRKKIERTATQEWAPAGPPAPHPERPVSTRADRYADRVWEGRMLSATKNVRRATGGLRVTCDRARPGGVVAPH